MIFKNIVRYGDLNNKIYKGCIEVSGEKLTSLEGCPKQVDNNFYCDENNLETLKYRPKKINASFVCSDNNLKTLEYSPTSVGQHYYCYNNNLISLKGRPKIIKGNFDCSSNKLKTLEGRPQQIDGNFDCGKNNLETLEGRPKIIGGIFIITGNKKITNFKKEIIKHQIKAKTYQSNIDVFNFEHIKEDFEEYRLKLEMLEKNKQMKIKMNSFDFGFSF